MKKRRPPRNRDLMRTEYKKQIKAKMKYYTNQGYEFNIDLDAMTTPELKTLKVTENLLQMAAPYVHSPEGSTIDIPKEEWEYYKKQRQKARAYENMYDGELEGELYVTSMTHFNKYVKSIEKRATKAYWDIKAETWKENYLSVFEAIKGLDDNVDYIYEQIKDMDASKMYHLLKKYAKRNITPAVWFYASIGGAEQLSQNVGIIADAFGITLPESNLP